MSARVDIPCTVRVEVSAEYCHAHVELDGNPRIEPGDRVRVHGDPIRIGYGEQRTMRRTATIVRAGPLRRWWTRLTGDLQLTELYEVSFVARGVR